MRFKLKDFQVATADSLMERLVTARFGASHNQPQALVLSSPTGSGKTVIVTEMIERVLQGHDGQAGDPRAVFLWLSDSPQLNEQSKNKIEEASDLIPADRLVTIEYPFNVERLAPGRVYFLNTQKLTASSLLTKVGDRQERTIWTLVENTVKAAPTSFYLIIDEAHRGMQDAGRSQAAQTRSENARLTTVQRFVLGDKAAGLSPVPLIVGISATPERFHAVLNHANRAAHTVDVPPEDVRDSGLIKDRIKLAIAEKGDEADWSMLADAGRRWRRYTDEWAGYCTANGIADVVRPVLVVQVENGNEQVTTKTSLATCIKVLTDACGPLPPAAFAHCFEHDADEPAGTIRLRKIEASRIQDDPDARVVFFKTALSTGWDCPRAEVMMSFRRAVDDTLIAQLVGRMVRTPLARRVETVEFLNGVSLALPHYNDDAVAAIVQKLQDPETGAAGEVVQEKVIADYPRAADSADLFEALAKLQTYVVTRPRRIPETSRLIKLARLLTFHGAAEEGQSKARRFVIDRLLERRDYLRRDPQWAARVDDGARIAVKEFTIEYGEWKTDAKPTAFFIEATDENIYDLFQRCGGILGEGLHESYANRPQFRGNINSARLELFYILQDEKALKLVQHACEKEFNRLWQEHKEDVALMRPAAQEKYKELRRRGGRAAPESMTLVQGIEVRKETPLWEHHLFADTKGKFGWDARTWEKKVLEAEMDRKEFAGFLRNVPRKAWSLCIPYGSANDQPMYPDLIAFRRTKAGVLVDILEPHGDHLADHLAKAQGLAHYAANHGDGLGRVEMIRVVKDKPERLDMQDDTIRGKVLKATTAEQLVDLYRELG